ncbi:hypothetical protein JOB18_043920 [Solea senegalensis]|uniref:Uncharacterized protein n=1 Tax=Solea senegalensis TaxID=28829 RepID=A0AAV6R3B8_SOLSE|nr:hypothetical protein JOB18_043920 [Solea senegalensis]
MICRLFVCLFACVHVDFLLASSSGRTVDVSRPSVLDDFNALVRQHGMGDDAVVVNHIKGECPPASTSQSQVPESKMAS